jgi:hypothetical protein
MRKLNTTLIGGGLIWLALWIPFWVNPSGPLELIQQLFLLARLLLLVSVGAIIAGMGFTYAYAYGEFSGYNLVDIPQMARWHGVLNAMGFALAGLGSWYLVRPPAAFGSTTKREASQ